MNAENSRSAENVGNVSKVVGATSSEGFLVDGLCKCHVTCVRNDRHFCTFVT